MKRERTAVIWRGGFFGGGAGGGGGETGSTQR